MTKFAREIYEEYRLTTREAREDMLDDLHDALGEMIQENDALFETAWIRTIQNGKLQKGLRAIVLMDTERDYPIPCARIMQNIAKETLEDVEVQTDRKNQTRKESHS